MNCSQREVPTDVARGLKRAQARTLGNFWRDLTRATLYVLLPLSIVWALLLVSQGVVQNLSSYVTAHPLGGGEQLLPMGPAASQIAIKQLGTNGGGFFGVNSAHPFENPTPLSNFLQVLAILLVPAALPFTFGRLAGNARHGLALFGAMFVLFLATLVLLRIARQNHVTQIVAGKSRAFSTSRIFWGPPSSVSRRSKAIERYTRSWRATSGRCVVTVR